jgi:carbon storage regulator
MLVLTRKPGQKIFIGDDIKITLMEIRGNQARIGIDAPESFPICREEIYGQKKGQGHKESEAKED